WTDERALERNAADEGDPEGGEERAPVRQPAAEQARGDVRRDHRHLPLREVDHPGGAVDERERNRKARVDPPAGKPDDDVLKEVRHAPRGESSSSGGRDARSVAEVTSADGLVRAQLGARSFEGDLSGLEDVRPRGGIERERRVLLDDENGKSVFLVEPPDDVVELTHD